MASAGQISEGVPLSEPEPEPQGDGSDLSAGWTDGERERAELSKLKKRDVNKRARAAGVDADAIEELWEEEDDAKVPTGTAKAAVIELTVKALRAAAEVAATSGATLVRTEFIAPREEMNRKYQQQLLQQSAHVDQGKMNIKQRLDDGREWKAFETPTSNWWQTDMASQVNRLRAAARIRGSLPDDTRKEIPGLYPQLVVLGEGNTGKSTVLNRFAEFAFSAISDGTCTRRPVRLQLRPVQADNRARMQDENLLAICKMVDEQDQVEEEFKFRREHREEDEGALRGAVESRASRQGALKKDAKQAAYNLQYIEEELVITIEADQMIYFDMIDLPGLHNWSPMPKKMVKKYINSSSLSRTFVLIFSKHEQGDTQLDQR